MALVQSRHWWFMGRKKIFSTLISKLGLPSNAFILEIGAGTGANLEMLSKFGQVVACESDHDSCKFLNDEGWEAFSGSLPDSLPSFNLKFDLICLFDVLEHVENDFASIAKIKSLLSPGGVLIIACPAYQWLFGGYDAKLGHYRRYTKTHLNDLLINNDLTIIQSGYINSILFPMVALARFLEFLHLDKRKNALRLPNRCINKILTNIFIFEEKFIKRRLLPFGVSVVSIAKFSKNKK